MPRSAERSSTRSRVPDRPPDRGSGALTRSFAHKGTPIPWRAKLAAKVILSHVPVDYALWRKVGVFRHGAMEEADYAMAVFMRHYGRCRERVDLGSGFVALELGPGDSLASAVIAKTFGASRTYLVDTGHYAVENVRPYADLVRRLRERGLDPPDLGSVKTAEGLLEAVDATYLTRGLRSLQTIPDACVDAAWSHAVLEHVRAAELGETLRQLRRVMKVPGAASHTVDLRDHLGGALNHLRFSNRFWDSEAIRRAGLYTNRLRLDQMLEVMTASGFKASILSVTRWEHLPTPLKKMRPEFSELGLEQLSVSGFDVLLEPEG